MKNKHKDGRGNKLKYDVWSMKKGEDMTMDADRNVVSTSIRAYAKSHDINRKFKCYVKDGKTVIVRVK